MRRGGEREEKQASTDSLRTALKRKICTDIVDVALGKMDKKYSMLICDDETIKILNYCMKMHELNEKNIGVVLNVQYPRERVNIHPIYFISPAEDSLDLVMRDYENERRTQYGKKIHVFFSGPVSQHLLEKIRANATFRRYLATLTEVHCDFLALESRAFSLNRENSFRTLYVFRDGSRKTEEIRAVARQLIGVCMTLDEDPYIRSSSSRSATDLARLFEQQFGDVKANWQGFEARPERATLFILDRSDDPFAPLVHEFSYQAMIMDLLNDQIEGRNITIGEDEKSESSLLEDETNDIWLRYRHLFIRDVLETLSTEFNDWKNSSKVVQLRGKTSSSTEGLIEAAREMPQYQSKIRAYKQHINIARACSDLFRSQNIATISELEQDMGTGINEDGHNTDKTRIQQRMVEILQDMNVSKQIKLRLFMMYMISQGGLSRDARNNIFQQAEFTDEEQDIVRNLAGLNVPLEPQSRDTRVRNKQYLDELKRLARGRVESGEFSRYSSYLEWMLKHHLQDSLSTDDFPWKSPPAAAPRKTGGRSWRKAKKKQAVEADGPRLIVFILGGMTYGEMRTCYQLSQEMRREIYIGSTQTLSPQKYLELLNNDS